MFPCQALGGLIILSYLLYYHLTPYLPAQERNANPLPVRLSNHDHLIYQGLTSVRNCAHSQSCWYMSVHKVKMRNTGMKCPSHSGQCIIQTCRSSSPILTIGSPDVNLSDARHRWKWLAKRTVNGSLYEHRWWLGYWFLWVQNPKHPIQNQNQRRGSTRAMP